MENELIKYQTVIDDIRKIIQSGINTAYQATNAAMIMTYWSVGRRIVEEEQHGNARAEYGKQLLITIGKEISREYGNNYSERNLRYYRQFIFFSPTVRFGTHAFQISTGRICAPCYVLRTSLLVYGI